MAHIENAGTGELRWHRTLVMAVRVVVGTSLVLMVYLFTRLPIEELALVADRFSARSAAIRQLDASVDAALRDGTSRAPVAKALAAVRALPCRAAAQAVADTAALDTLARIAASPAGPAPDSAALLRSRAPLRELAASGESCMQLEVAAIATVAVRVRYAALALIATMLLGVVGVIVMRRHDQRQLREQLRFNEQLIDAIPLPLSMRSPDGRFMLLNRAFEQKHKVRREHLLGQPVSATLPKVDADAVAMMDARAAASFQPVEESFHIVSPGVDRHVFVRVHALRGLDNSVLGTIGIQTDITALRRKEAQLTETNTKLSQLSMKMIDAQEDERRRIARDLHDQVGQILTALKLQLASLARRARIDAPADAMTTPIDLAEEALRHTRDLSASLHPHLLDDLGIEPALHWLIERFIRPSVATIELRCRLFPPRGPEAIELVAFRVVQEALTNVVRHADATRVGVILEAAAGELTIEVIDDGVGFEAGNTWFDLQRSTSLGVTSMRDRVTEVGGELRMESTPGVGTSLRVRLPWSEP